ncbi:MAG: hypothetical protein R3224_08930 [Balneolaceae bacterium]|nr:hypothetical protein [Balneolaceae bacterium]
MITKHRTAVLLAAFSLILFAHGVPANAQNEIERERSSLRGISEMGFTVNLEVNVTLNEKGELEVTSLRDRALNTLRDAGLDIIPDKEIESSAEVPFLYMHVNTMDAGQGLVPFSVSIRFYQPVKLTLNRDIQTSASTWESGLVGIVSYDRMNVIGDSAVNLLQDFISDYNRVNL